MTNLYNTDSFGNHYYNYFNGISSGEPYDNTSFLTFLQNAFGVNNVAANGSEFVITPPSANETITSNTELTLYRFKFSPTNTAYQSFWINSNNGNGFNAVSTTGTTNPSFIANPYIYAIANSESLCLAAFNAPIPTDATAYRLIYCGWLKEQPHSGGLIPRGASLMYLASNTQEAFHPLLENASNNAAYLTSGDANYPITCSDGDTPSASDQTTDLALREASNSYAVGKCWNLLKTTETTFDVGKVYKLDKIVDGNTEENIWLCGAELGTEKILMRVWTEALGVSPSLQVIG